MLIPSFIDFGPAIPSDQVWWQQTWYQGILDLLQTVNPCQVLPGQPKVYPRISQFTMPEEPLKGGILEVSWLQMVLDQERRSMGTSQCRLRTRLGSPGRGCLMLKRPETPEDPRLDHWWCFQVHQCSRTNHVNASTGLGFLISFYMLQWQ